MKATRDFLQKCSIAYYKGNPIVSDEIYDVLEERYGNDDIGYDEIGGRVRHLVKMYSLQKYYTDDTNFPKYKSEIKTPKLDGSAISLLYMGGHLIQAATRGNGSVGEDITDKLIAGNIVPSQLNVARAVLHVTGEIVAPKTIQNARNYAAGALHLKDLEEFKSRDISFIAYGVFPRLSSLYDVELEYLSTNYGFRTVLEDGLEDIYPTDGTVVRENNNVLFDRLGFTAKHPKGAYALKNRADVAVEEATLLDVKWQLGKGGKVTPVAIFTEVTIEDAKITKATLHNPGFVKDMDLQIGDTILVTRSGGVIPKVIGKL